MASTGDMSVQEAFAGSSWPCSPSYTVLQPDTAHNSSPMLPHASLTTLYNNPSSESHSMAFYANQHRSPSASLNGGPLKTPAYAAAPYVNGMLPSNNYYPTSQLVRTVLSVSASITKLNFEFIFAFFRWVMECRIQVYTVG